MPKNKDADFRYRILDRCFKNKYHWYTFEELLQEINDSLYEKYGEGKSIKERQLREDIKEMRDSAFYNAPIETYPAEGRKKYYRYSDPDFSIYNSSLSEEESSKLQSAFDALNHFRNNPAYANIATALSEIEYTFGLTPNRENLISFGENKQFTGLEFLAELIEYTVHHKPFKIRYESYRGTIDLTIVHPYYMKQYNNRWFLFGFNEGKAKVSTFALDRIKYIEPTEQSFRPNESIDYSTWFDEVVGVTIKNVPVETVRLKFSPERLPYVISKPIHHTQELVDREGCVVEIKVRPNRELNQQILSFGADVEVLSPVSLRSEIAEKIAESHKKYFAMQNACIDDAELCDVNDN